MLLNTTLLTDAMDTGNVPQPAPILLGAAPRVHQYH
jgi:hypothetical protein